MRFAIKIRPEHTTRNEIRDVWLATSALPIQDTGGHSAYCRW
jgi:hypothetical protein